MGAAARNVYTRREHLDAAHGLDGRVTGYVFSRGTGRNGDGREPKAMTRTSDAGADEPGREEPAPDGGLAVYLNDHLAGSAAGLRLARRCLERERGTKLGRRLEALVGEIEEDRAVLERVMARVGATPNPLKQAAASGVVLLSILKNRVPVLGSGSGDVSRLEEVELLSLGIEGKRLLWRALGALAKTDRRLKEFEFATLEGRAQAQRDLLERFRLELASTALGGSG